jgi:hypothetical protein
MDGILYAVHLSASAHEREQPNVRCTHRPSEPYGSR